MSHVEKTSINSSKSKTHLPNIKGLAYAASSYVLWGLFPLYWKLLGAASALEITAHRMLWAAVILFIVVVLFRRRSLKPLFSSKRAMLILSGAAVLIAANWFIFIYAVEIGHVVATSLGYFINPICNICIGMLIFKERLTLVQKVATGLALCGVVYFVISNGEPEFIPIALSLPILFGFYGALKKKGGYPAAEALTVESALLLPLALILVIFFFVTSERTFLADVGSIDNLLLSGGFILGGGVTAIPLLLFALGVNSVSLTWMGFIQYLSPSISLFIGVFLFGEPFTFAHIVCFGFIWIGLLCISAEIALQWCRDSKNSKNLSP